MSQLPLFPIHFHMRVYNLLRHLGIPPEIASAEVEHYKEVRYARTESRQILGILNDVAGNYQAFADAQIGQGSLPVSEAEISIASVPFGAPKYKTPLAEVRKALGVDAG